MKQIFEQYGEAIIAFIGAAVVIGIITAVLISGGFLADIITRFGNAAV